MLIKTCSNKDSNSSRYSYQQFKLLTPWCQWHCRVSHLVNLNNLICLQFCSFAIFPDFFKNYKSPKILSLYTQLSCSWILEPNEYKSRKKQCVNFVRIEIHLKISENIFYMSLAPRCQWHLGVLHMRICRWNLVKILQQINKESK